MASSAPLLPSTTLTRSRLKMAEPGFSVSEFVSGARGAYEMILMAFENGELDGIKDLLDEDVYQTFINVVADREDRGLRIEAEFVGVREVGIVETAIGRRRRTG